MTKHAYSVEISIRKDFTFYTGESDPEEGMALLLEKIKDLQQHGEYFADWSVLRESHGEV